MMIPIMLAKKPPIGEHILIINAVGHILAIFTDQLKHVIGDRPSEMTVCYRSFQRHNGTFHLAQIMKYDLISASHHVLEPFHQLFYNLKVRM